MSVLPPNYPPAPLVSRPKRYSFAFMVGLLILTAILHLGVLFLTVLFSSLLLHLLAPEGKKKPVAISVYLLVITVSVWVASSFITQAVIALPTVAETTIPKLLALAQQHGRELPFTDWDSLRKIAMDSVIQQTRYLTNVAALAEWATRVVLQLLVGGVVAVSIFINSRINLDRDEPDSLYGLCSQEIAGRFRTFFYSFRTVMGAQLVISAINTALTGAYLAAIQIPHHIVLIGLTFIAGMLPVVGNLISSTVIVAVAFTVSPKLAIWSIIFLIVLHKLEYFLNSKIVGDRIRTPIWLTLLGLVVGELLMGMTGMILAPVFLHYLKAEASKIKLAPEPDDAAEESLKSLQEESPLPLTTAIDARR